jgi:hypothetical protein
MYRLRAPLAPARSPLRLALGVAGALALAACGSSSTPGPEAPARTGPLAPWAGPLGALFPDAIDPAAVGLAMMPGSPRSDPYLRDRTQASEVLARVRVSTVTSELVGDQPTYHLALVPFGEALVPGPPPPDRVEIVVRPGSAGAGVLKALQGRMVGRTFIGFFRSFAGGDEPVVHFHLAPDSPETAAGVREAAALGEFLRR